MAWERQTTDGRDVATETEVCKPNKTVRFLFNVIFSWFPFLFHFITIPFSAMLLVGQQEGHNWPVKKLSGGMLAWLSTWGEVHICIWLT